MRADILAGQSLSSASASYLKSINRTCEVRAPQLVRLGYDGPHTRSHLPDSILDINIPTVLQTEHIRPDDNIQCKAGPARVVPTSHTQP